MQLALFSIFKVIREVFTVEQIYFSALFKKDFMQVHWYNSKLFNQVYHAHIMQQLAIIWNEG